MELTKKNQKKNVQVASSTKDPRIKMSAIKVCVLCYKLAQQYLLYKIERHSNEPIQDLNLLSFSSIACHKNLGARFVCVAAISVSVTRQEGCTSQYLYSFRGYHAALKMCRFACAVCVGKSLEMNEAENRIPVS